MNFNIKKAAMFGLDARIALAIFGALSVISGAALYSAIQSSKAEQWRQNFEELVKASELYYLDNGSPLPYTSEIMGITSVEHLVSNEDSSSTWRGPYIDGVGAGSGIIRTPFTLSQDSNFWIVVKVKQKSEWDSDSISMSSGENCSVGSSDCSEWIVMYRGIGDLNVFENVFSILDNLVDSGDGKRLGKVRYSGTSNGYIFYQGIPRIR